MGETNIKMRIETRKHPTGPQINLTSESLRKKFSVVEKKDGTFVATAANGNDPLISFINSQQKLVRPLDVFDKNYYGWEIKPGKVISLIRKVIKEFG